MRAKDIFFKGAEFLMILSAMAFFWLGKMGIKAMAWLLVNVVWPTVSWIRSVDWGKVASYATELVVRLFAKAFWIGFDLWEGATA